MLTSSVLDTSQDCNYRPMYQAPCPHCAEPCRYSVATHRVTCPGCGWQVKLSPAEAQDLLWGLAGCSTLDLGAFLAVLATRCAPVAAAPPAVFSAGGPGVLKQRVAPAPDETPRQRAERLAEQYSLNGGHLRFADGIVYATSQQRRESDLAPLAEYQIRRPNGRDFECTCRHTGLCSHVAAYWARLREKLADPDQRTRLTPAEYERTWLTINHLELQFGIAARGQTVTEGVVIPPPVKRATVTDLTAELYGGAA